MDKLTEGSSIQPNEQNSLSNGPEQQAETRSIIRQVRDEAFDSSDEQLALALGRPVEQVKAMAEGSEEPDDDVVIKLARHCGATWRRAER